MTNVKSKTRVKELRRVLPPSDLNVRVARLVVLFEDLRIEAYGLGAPSLSVLDYTDEAYRKLYFLRRAIATVLEFRGALLRLDQHPDFQITKTRFGKEDVCRWDKAIEFFEQNKGLFKTVRDDVGGHFQERAAEYALQNISSEVVAKMGIVRGGEKGAGPKLYFAGEIVTIAVTAHKGANTPEQFFEELVALLMEAVEYAPFPVHLMSVHYLWDRFGS